MKKKAKVAIVGYGTVGTGTYKLLKEYDSLVEVKWVIDKDLKRERIEYPPLSKFKDDINLAMDDDVDIVVELIGGYEPARSLILTALRKGKNVVTANKAVLSKYYNEIISSAIEQRCLVSFEASVACGIPIISTLIQGLFSERVKKIFGIINATTNYILTKMEKEALDFSVALAKAQEEGYAEADPSLDINGDDTLHKLSILSFLTFKGYFDPEKIYKEGIAHIGYKDIIYADELGYKIKLLGIAEELEDSLYQIKVCPCMIPKEHIFANVDGVYNAIYLVCERRGNLLFYGKGAGMMPAAAAVVCDIVNLAKQIQQNELLVYDIRPQRELKIKPIEETESCFYLRFLAVDRPGVLAAIASILAKYQISISAVVQKERGDIVPIVMLTHKAKEESMQKALNEIDKLEVIKSKTVLIRLADL